MSGRIGPNLLTISDKVVTLKDADAASLRAALERVYSEVPGTSCECDRLGQCCELTEEEMRSGFATMYPVYAAEYLNIVGYVASHNPPEERDRLLSLTEERPVRCPFLTEEGGCGIHPARPLMCRTYGVLRRENLLAAAERNSGLMPISWVNGFLSVESTAICTQTRVLDPDRIARHEDNMIQGVYDQALSELSRSVPLLMEPRQGLLRALTGLDRVVKWTWGGFNALARSSDAWFEAHFGDYWRRSELAE